MAALTITLTGICSGGNHLTFGISGDRSATVRGSLDDILAPLTEEDVVAFLRVVCKLAKAGRTTAQARALLQAGVTVTI